MYITIESQAHHLPTDAQLTPWAEEESDEISKPLQNNFHMT